ncbi:hypothetical protein DFQ27_009734 [Actinomortierella ambigua]|uniref:Uncharacterized protein n=1 Tax=Actinomortierella ambigua TaxID=1343610 RepID=A0A9P6QIN9_9FUNG|nr:hypothetical protein DFQ27_009734 [Actinomortierella ambigua]
MDFEAASPLVSAVLLLVAVVPERAQAARGGGAIGSALANSGLSVGAIIGIIVGIIVLCLLIGFCQQACKENPHTTATDPVAVTVVPHANGILPTPQPQPAPGNYYPPMSPVATPAGTEAARPVTADEYNRIYSQIGLDNNATSKTLPATPTPVPGNVNVAPAPSVYPSPAIAHNGTISAAASPYMSSTTGNVSATASPYMSNTTGSISVVASPYMGSAVGGGGAGVSTTQLSSFQPAPAMPYPVLPPAASTLAQPFTPPSPNPPKSYPVMDATPTTNLAAATPASTYNYVPMPTAGSEMTTTAAFTPAFTPAAHPVAVPAPAATAYATTSSVEPVSMDHPSRVRTVQIV